MDYINEKKPCEYCEKEFVPYLDYKDHCSKQCKKNWYRRGTINQKPIGNYPYTNGNL